MEPEKLKIPPYIRRERPKNRSQLTNMKLNKSSFDIESLRKTTQIKFDKFGPPRSAIKIKKVEKKKPMGIGTNNQNFTQRWTLALEPFFTIIHCTNCKDHNLTTWCKHGQNEE
mgnify:CR=1 FL=1